MNPTLATITNYIARIALRRSSGDDAVHSPAECELRIVLYLSLFILLRDAMTPLGFWSFGQQEFFWMRLYRDPWFVVLFGIGCLGRMWAK